LYYSPIKKLENIFIFKIARQYTFRRIRLICKKKLRVLVETYIYTTAVAPGTVGTVPTVPLFLAGTANRTTISTEKNNFEMSVQ
jgi:hypothetical protein